MRFAIYHNGMASVLMRRYGFVFGSHSTFGLPSTSSMDTMRKSFVANSKSNFVRWHSHAFHPFAKTPLTQV